MMFILEGQVQLIKDSMVLNAGALNQKRANDAEKNKEGKKAGKRKRKAACFRQRPDKTKTLKRRAAQINISLGDYDVEMRITPKPQRQSGSQEDPIKILDETSSVVEIDDSSRQTD